MICIQLTTIKNAETYKQMLVLLAVYNNVIYLSMKTELIVQTLQTDL